MFISINQHIIKFEEYNSFEEMNNFLENCSDVITLEKKEGYESDYYALVVNRNDSTFLAPVETVKEKFGIGISSYRNVPIILPIEEKNLILLGLDNEVIGISLESKSVIFNISLMNLPFRGFFKSLKEKTILIFYELGVIAIDFEGKEIWGYDRDVLCESIIDKDKIVLEFLDLKTIALNIADGKAIENSGDFL